MTYEEENLKRLIEIIRDPRDLTVLLPNKPYVISSEDGGRGLVLFDLRDEGQRKTYDAMVSYVSAQRELEEQT